MDFILNPNLVLYLPLWKLDGSSFMSKDAYGHLCTVTGALWRPDGRYFDGTDDIISLDDSSMPLGDTSRTIVIWMKADDLSATKGLVRWGTAASKQHSALGISSAKLWYSGFANDLTADTALSVDTWYHCVFTWDGTTGKLYYNARLDGSSALTAHNTVSGGTLLVAAYADPTVRFWFNGSIGEVRIYSKALTLQEVQHNYLATKWRYR